MDNDRFWDHIDRLVADSRIVVDRPVGSRDPRFTDCVYPYDYGYLEGTDGGDGDGIDVWIGTRGDRRCVGAICTVDLGRRDAEVKLLLGCEPEEMAQILGAHNFGGRGGLLVPRPGA